MYDNRRDPNYGGLRAGDRYENRRYNRDSNRDSDGFQHGMMYSAYDDDEPDGCGQCLKYLLVIFNIIFLLAGIGVCAGSIYILVDHTFVSDVIGNVLLTVACWLVIVGSGITIFISIVGCCGASKDNRCMLLVYCGFLVGILLILLSGGIIALSLKGEIGDWVIVEMENTLKDDYGINLDKKYNQIVTQAWDQGQKKMYCCAVRDLSWGIYRQSLWFAEQPGIEMVDKPYVPLSCCKQDNAGDYLEVRKCQTYYLGPPGVPSGPYNEALHYRGCYTAGQEWIDYYANWLAGLGMGLGAAMGLGIFSSVWLAIRIKKQRKM